VADRSLDMVVGVTDGSNSWRAQSTIITDQNGDQWSITADGRVAVNGVADQNTDRVLALAYENGVIWQMNADGLWWSKGSASDAWGPDWGTRASPVPLASLPAQTYAAVFTAGLTSQSIGGYIPAGYNYLTFDGVGRPVTLNYYAYNTEDQVIYNAHGGLVMNVGGVLTLGGTLLTQGGMAAATTTLNLTKDSAFRNLGMIQTTTNSFAVRSNMIVEGAGNFENYGQIKLNGGSFNLNTTGEFTNTGQLWFASFLGTSHRVVTSAGILNSGTIDNYNIATMQWGTPLGSPKSFTNNGLISTGSHSTLTLIGNNTLGDAYVYNNYLINNGSIACRGAGSTIEIAAPVHQSDSGHIDISYGSRVILDSSSDGGTINITDATLRMAGDNMSFVPPGASGMHSDVALYGNTATFQFATHDLTLADTLTQSWDGTYDLAVTGSAASGNTVQVADIHLVGGYYQDRQFQVSGGVVYFNRDA
jgi:hypothetical protein